MQDSKHIKIIGPIKLLDLFKFLLKSLFFFTILCKIWSPAMDGCWVTNECIPQIFMQLENCLNTNHIYHPHPHTPSLPSPQSLSCQMVKIEIRQFL